MKIKNQYKLHIRSFLFGTIISLCFLSISMLMAWTSPLGNPPENNVLAPINISAQGQIKQGGLMLNTAGADVGLVVSHGNVGIGIESPTAKLDVAGGIDAQGDINTAGKIYSSDDICISSGACLSDINYFIGAQPLVHSAHTKKDCIDASGEVVDSDVELSQCRFDVATCPSGWTQYKNFSTTTDSPVCGAYPCGPSGSYSSGCSCPGHAWDDYIYTTCTPIWYGCGRNEWEVGSGEQAPCECFCPNLQIGCY